MLLLLLGVTGIMEGLELCWLLLLFLLRMESARWEKMVLVEREDASWRLSIVGRRFLVKREMEEDLMGVTSATSEERGIDSGVECAFR